MTPAPPPDGGSPRPANLARRLAPALVVLGVGGAAIWALDRPGPVTSDEAADLSADVVTTTAIPPSTTRPGQTTTTVPGTRSTTTTVAPSPTCSGSTRTVNGSTITTRFGPIQVAAVVGDDKRICSLSAPQSPNNDRRSVAINNQAVPILNARALAAGTTSFLGVSGATYTSNGYKQSLQSILDKL